MNMGFTFLDFFAGIGGFRRGMEIAGHKCIGFCELDKYAVASYTIMHLATNKQREYIKNIPVPLKKNGEPNLKERQKEILKEEYRNGEWYADDIRAVDARSMPKADCWCFGFPCQDISIAGNCLGFQGKRSSLFFAVTGIIRDTKEEDRPSYLLIENVKNLLSVNGGFDFARLLIELDEIGYDAEWDLLNSKYFGVPQNRERVFIVGHLRGRSTRKVFPLGETDSLHNTAEEVGQVHEVAQCLTAGGNDKWQGDYIVKQIGNCMPTATRNNPNQGRIYDTSGIAPCLNKMDGGGQEPLIPINCINIKDEDGKERPQQDRVYGPDGIMTALNAQLAGRHNVAIPISMTQKSFHESDITPTLTARWPSRGRGNNSPVPGVAMVAGVYTGTSENFSRKPLEGLSRCLKSEKHDAGVFNGKWIRRLIPKECFRLQGWDDEYFYRAELINSDNQLYKQAGNGVTVPVIRAIALRMAIDLQN